MPQIANACGYSYSLSNQIYKPWCLSHGGMNSYLPGPYCVGSIKIYHPNYFYEQMLRMGLIMKVVC